MLGRIITGLLVLGLLAAAPAWPANLPATTEALVKVLAKCGYEYKGHKKDCFIFARNQSAVAISLNDKALVYEGVLAIGPQADIPAARGALYVIYSALQLNMGKKEVLDKNLAISKMRNLLDAVTSNLKVVSETKFRFDDLHVKATRDDKANLINITLWPYW